MENDNGKMLMEEIINNVESIVVEQPYMNDVCKAVKKASVLFGYNLVKYIIQNYREINNLCEPESGLTPFLLVSGIAASHTDDLFHSFIVSLMRENDIIKPLVDKLSDLDGSHTDDLETLNTLLNVLSNMKNSYL